MKRKSTIPQDYQVTNLDDSTNLGLAKITTTYDDMANNIDTVNVANDIKYYNNLVVDEDNNYAMVIDNDEANLLDVSDISSDDDDEDIDDCSEDDIEREQLLIDDDKNNDKGDSADDEN